jgi:hypothetical protein
MRRKISKLMNKLSINLITYYECIAGGATAELTVGAYANMQLQYA